MNNTSLYCNICDCKCIHIITSKNYCNHKCNKKNICKIEKNECKSNTILDTIDTKLDQQVDYLQNQLNIINKSYIDVINNIKTTYEQHNIVVNEINKINDTIENIIINNNHQHTCSHTCGKIIYTEPKEHVFVIEHDIKFIYLTGIAGGGSGGVGCIKDMFYYSGGGGGAGSCIINKPVSVIKGTIITFTIGKGGYCSDGGDTIINIKYPDGKMEIIILNGGKKAEPFIEMCPYTTENINNINIQISVSGGKGGISTLCTFSGKDGEDGNISVPSYLAIESGNGACSHFYKGGEGGSNYFSKGGIGGVINALIGQDGIMGSGGGGSAPKSIIEINEKITGRGGNGMLIIEW